jgi:hypothetical protein
MFDLFLDRFVTMSTFEEVEVAHGEYFFLQLSRVRGTVKRILENYVSSFVEISIKAW